MNHKTNEIIEKITNATCDIEDNDTRTAMIEAIENGHEMLLAAHPGVGLFFLESDETLDDDRVEEELNSFAQACWSEDWPMTDQEYPAWIVDADGFPCRVAGA